MVFYIVAFDSSLLLSHRLLFPFSPLPPLSPPLPLGTPFNINFGLLRRYGGKGPLGDPRPDQSVLG